MKFISTLAVKEMSVSMSKTELLAAINTLENTHPQIGVLAPVPTSPATGRLYSSRVLRSAINKMVEIDILRSSPTTSGRFLVNPKMFHDKDLKWMNEYYYEKYFSYKNVWEEALNLQQRDIKAG